MPSTTDTREPAQVFQYDRPVQGGPTLSQEVRDNFCALAQTFYGTDPTNPAAPRIGQVRILREEPPAFANTNVKFQWFDGSAWRDLLQRIEGGLPAPTKLLIDFQAPLASWVIDHNLGSQPVVQAFDATFRQLAANPSAFPTETVFIGNIPAAVLTALAGTQSLRAAFRLPFAGSLVRTWAMAHEAISGGPPNGQLEFELSGGGGPVAGGQITLGTTGLGVEIPGAPVTGNNNFAAGDTLELRSVVTTPPTAGGLDVYVDALRTGVGYQLDHPTPNRVIITHPAPTAGFALLLG